MVKPFEILRSGSLSELEPDSGISFKESGLTNFEVFGPLKLFLIFLQQA